jgi:hypothetical protein
MRWLQGLVVEQFPGKAVQFEDQVDETVGNDALDAVVGVKPTIVKDGVDPSIERRGGNVVLEFDGDWRRECLETRSATDARRER